MYYRNCDYEHNSMILRCYNKILTFRLPQSAYTTLFWWTTGEKICNTVCVQRPHSRGQLHRPKCTQRHSTGRRW